MEFVQLQSQMYSTFVLCRYLEYENGKVELEKPGEYDTEEKAKIDAVNFYDNEGSSFVVLTVWKPPFDSRAF